MDNLFAVGCDSVSVPGTIFLSLGDVLLAGGDLSLVSVGEVGVASGESSLRVSELVAGETILAGGEFVTTGEFTMLVITGERGRRGGDCGALPESVVN